MCESQIAGRRALIEQLRREGHSTEQAESALATLEQTLKTLREYLEILQRSNK